MISSTGPSVAQTERLNLLTQATGHLLTCVAVAQMNGFDAREYAGAPTNRDALRDAVVNVRAVLSLIEGTDFEACTAAEIDELAWHIKDASIAQ